MARRKAPVDLESPRVAAYLRVSSEDQATTGTIQTQRHFFDNWLRTYPNQQLVDWYVDDGVSGTIPLRRRPEGRRLMDDAALGKFDVVVVYRLDRLARTLRNLLDAHDELDALDIAIRSANEPFDTTTHLGKLVFQLLGSLAEFERSSILQRTIDGRDRVASKGGHHGGVVPVGYQITAEKRYVLSDVLIPELGLTEAEFIADLFVRLDGGSTLYYEADRLNALGVRPARRYASGQVRYDSKKGWSSSRLSYIAHNPIYIGRLILGKHNGRPVEGAVPPIITEEVFRRVQRRLLANRSWVRTTRINPYLLAGRIFCAYCDSAMTGQSKPRDGGKRTLYYLCNGAYNQKRVPPCPSRSIRADVVEPLIWADCLAFLQHPADYLNAAYEHIRGLAAPVEAVTAERHSLSQRLADKEAERERVTTLYRKHRITLEEAEAQFDEIDRDVATLQTELLRAQSQRTLAVEAEARYTEIEDFVRRYAAELPTLEHDFAWRRKVVEGLVERVVVAHAPEDGDGQIKAYYTFRNSSTGSSVKELSSYAELLPGSFLRHAFYL